MKKDEEHILEQPTDDEQREYLSLMDNDATVVKVRNRKFKIRWLHGVQMEKVSRILLSKKDVDEPADNDPLDAICEDSRLACKIAAVYVLNNWLKLKLFYWFLWRWFYFVKNYSFTELQPLLLLGKKKIPQMQFYQATTLLIGAKATLMTMRAKEVEAFLHAQDMAQRSEQRQSDGRGL